MVQYVQQVIFLLVMSVRAPLDTLVLRVPHQNVTFNPAKMVVLAFQMVPPLAIAVHVRQDSLERHVRLDFYYFTNI